MPLPLVEEKTRFEIAVTVQLHGLPALPLVLVVFANNEGDAILTAHGQLEALVNRRHPLKSIAFGRSEGGAS